MELNTIPTFASSLFTYNRETKTYIAEASTLQGPTSAGAFFGQIYDDACDVGLRMASPHPAGKATFYLDQEHEDNEGDTTHWTFKPTSETLRRIPALNGVTVTVLND